MATLPVYELSNLDGVRVSSPQAEGALVCFIKEDCPTCQELMPVLDAFFAHYFDMQQLCKGPSLYYVSKRAECVDLESGQFC